MPRLIEKLHEDLERASQVADGFGNFLRSLVGLDKGAATAVFSKFLSTGATADQIEFINMIIDHLTENGTMDAGLLYESPFKDMAPQGPEELFSEEKVVDLIKTIKTASNPDAASSVG